MNALVRQIAVLSVLWALCEMLLPDGKHQHMVRMTASLLIMTALFTTVSGWMGGAQHAAPAMTFTVQQAAEDTYRRTALTAVANQVKSWCERMAERAGYQADAAVYMTMEGMVDHVELVLEPSEEALVTAERLAHTVAEGLGIASEQIRLSVEGP